MELGGCVYILTNQTNHVLYTGVTSNLVKRVYEHKNDVADGFTKKYHVHKLVYFEKHATIELAISREKQIKAGSRENKIRLIEISNPDYQDLYQQLL